MWIRRKALEQLVTRIEGLELRERERFSKDYITVYENVSPMFWIAKRKDASLREVVELILEGIGMKLKYKEGKSDSVELEKIPHVAKHPRR